MAYFNIERVPFCCKMLQGFTLLELLVALVIFAIMAIMAYGSLDSILTARFQTTQQAQQLARLQSVFTGLKRDIEQWIDRPIRDQYGDFKLSIQGAQSQIELTRAGWRNPAQHIRSSLQRVAYHLEEDTLWRYYWQVLDRAQDSQPLKIALLNEVEEIQFRYLDNHLQWHPQWPIFNPLETIPDQKLNPKLTLKAIELNLIVKKWGLLTYLCQVPQS